MNLGAEQASGRFYIFLHADTILPQGWSQMVRDALEEPHTALAAFRIGFRGGPRGMKQIAMFANLRTRLFHLPLGDQVFCLTREIFSATGGFPEEPLLEDLIMVRKARRLGAVRIMDGVALSSPRRWETKGVFRATLLNQLILLAFFMGISPSRLARLYFT